MVDLTIKRPLTRTSEEMVSLHVRERIVQYYPNQDPHYFIDLLGNLNPLEIDRVDNAVSLNINIGDIFLRQRNIVSCGIRKDGSLEKFMGLRPDFNQHTGEEQMEFSLESIEINGTLQPLDLSRNIPLSSTMMDLGSLIVHSSRQWTRQYVRVPGDAKDFKFIFRIHNTGLSLVNRPDLDEFWFYSVADQGFRFRYPKPSVIDPNTMRSMQFVEDGDENPVQDLINHELVQDGKDLLYIKTPGPMWGKVKLPPEVWIDKSTVYSHTSDGWIYHLAATWDDVHHAATGTIVSPADAARDDCIFTKKTSASDWRIRRPFIGYDVSGEAGTVSACTNTVEGYVSAGSDVTLEAGTQADILTTADFDSLDVHKVSKTAYDTVTWAVAPNVFTLDATGIADLQAVVGTATRFKTVLREEPRDYQDVAPIGTTVSGVYFAEDATKDPFLTITYGAVGGIVPYRYYYGLMQG